MTIMMIVLATIVQSLVSGFLLWCGTRLTGEQGSFGQLAFSSFLASLVRWIPVAGTILSFVVLLLLVRRFTTASGVGIFLIVIVANGLGLMLSIMMLGLTT